MMVVHPPAVPTQAFGDVLRGIVERGIGVCRLALAAQLQSSAGMHIDIAGEETSCSAERNVRFYRMIEILASDRIHRGGYPSPQRIRDIDLLAGNRDLHRNLPTSSTPSGTID
jgi:hypothetical protein